jgi:hypothetical protein
MQTMATKQKQTKTKTQTQKGTKTKTAVIPAGYKVIERAPNWDFEKNPVIAGRRGETKDVTMDRGKATEREVRNFIVEDKVVGDVVVWESSGLRELFDRTDDGDDIRIEFLGYGEPPVDKDTGKQAVNRDTGEKMAAPKLFAAAVKK